MMEDLLLECIEQKKILRKEEKWNEILIPFASNVLWFGDLNNSKPKVIYVCLTPSKKEFVGAGDHELKPDKRRLFHLPKNEDEENLVKEIIISQNTYFKRRPYARFFGSKNPSWIEAFAQGMNASLYGLPNKECQAIVIDLVPFVVTSNYEDIENLINRDLINSGFIKSYIYKIIEKINPLGIVLMGETVSSVFVNSGFSQRTDFARTFVPHAGNKSTVTIFSDFEVTNMHKVPLVSLSRIPSSTAYGYSAQDCFGMGELALDMIRKVSGR